MMSWYNEKKSIDALKLSHQSDQDSWYNVL